MYAVIATGGKQERVEVGQRIAVERLSDQVGDEVSLRPVLVVDGDVVISTPEALSGASVQGRILGEAKGPKIVGFTYKPKTRGRRHFGHRQKYSTIEITAIAPSGASKS